MSRSHGIATSLICLFLNRVWDFHIWAHDHCLTHFWWFNPHVWCLDPHFRWFNPHVWCLNGETLLWFRIFQVAACQVSIRFANAKSSEAPSAGATLSHIGRSFSSNLLSEVMFPSYRHIRRIVYVYIIIYIWSMENSRIVVLCTVYDNCWKQMTQTLVQRRWGVSAGKKLSCFKVEPKNSHALPVTSPWWFMFTMSMHTYHPWW